MPTVRRKRSRKAVGEPKPACCAMRSTVWSLFSSRYWARRTRALSSHCRGVVPVCSRKRRPKVLSLIPGRAAIAATPVIQVAEEQGAGGFWRGNGTAPYNLHSDLTKVQANTTGLAPARTIGMTFAAAEPLMQQVAAFLRAH